MTPNGASASRTAIRTIVIPEAVRKAGQVTPEIMAEAVTFLHRDGILVLEDAIDISHLDALEDLLGPEAEEVARDPDHHYNFGKETRNMDQAPPLILDLMFEDVWANPVAISILKAVMGPNLVCHYANGNTALQATDRQPVHSDIEKPHPMFPFAYAINIPLCNMTPENGSTEIWPGSHRESCIDQHTSRGELTIKQSLLRARRQVAPPVQPTTKKGSLIIRDIRLWHAGMPNRTPVPRIMLAFVIQPEWYQAPSMVLLPRKAETIVESWRRNSGLRYAAQWVDGDVDHRKVTSDEVDFSTGNAKLLYLEYCMHPSA